MAATGRVRAPRAKSCRSRRRGQKPSIPATGHSFEIRINDVHRSGIPLDFQMIQIGVASTDTEISMALQHRLDAFKADFESGRFPPLKPTKQMLDIMHRATDALIAGAQAERARKAGDAAPEFTLNDSDG